MLSSLPTLPRSCLPHSTSFSFAFSTNNNKSKYPTNQKYLLLKPPSKIITKSMESALQWSTPPEHGVHSEVYVMCSVSLHWRTLLC